jgi:hypothetical protein
MKSKCTLLKLLGLVLRVHWEVLMIAFNYHVFTRSAVVYVEHVLIPVPKLSSIGLYQPRGDACVSVMRYHVK